MFIFFFFCSNSNNNLFQNLDIIDIGSVGLSVVGSNNTIDSCTVKYTGDGGISVSGGNRATLTPSGTVAAIINPITNE
jgi:parallel beta-helix repeat protein